VETVYNVENYQFYMSDLSPAKFNLNALNSNVLSLFRHYIKIKALSHWKYF
jgi:hypothetical protein